MASKIQIDNAVTGERAIGIVAGRQRSAESQDGAICYLGLGSQKRPQMIWKVKLEKRGPDTENLGHAKTKQYFEAVRCV